ncbi:hypothetical protein ACM6PT_43355, partial [Klebsiella pneumoniae]
QGRRIREGTWTEPCNLHWLTPGVTAILRGPGDDTPPLACRILSGTLLQRMHKDDLTIRKRSQ